MVLFEEVDHLLTVVSDRRGAVDPTARNPEPLPLLREELSEPARVAAIESGERLLQTIGAVAHRPQNTRPRRRRASSGGTYTSGDEQDRNLSRRSIRLATADARPTEVELVESV
jgi:hypothetical protein